LRLYIGDLAVLESLYLTDNRLWSVPPEFGRAVQIDVFKPRVDSIKWRMIL
jgi:hypothetical protein